ncbi:MAG: amidohydrolase [Ignavibacteriae bacterium]|nr:amidohydrolase [Ignavibacteriota bacterium]
MKARVLVPLVILVILMIYLLLSYFQPKEATMLLVNGVVYTANDTQPIAEAIAVEREMIVGVGSSEEIRRSFKAATVVDLQGRPVYPGFTDSHAHLEGLGALLANVNLMGTNSLEEIQKLVADRVKTVPDGAWIRGRGWDQNRWSGKSFPTHQILDTVAPDVPVFLKRVDGHAAWVNKKALDLAGITNTTLDPPGGRIIRDKNGRPTGVFIDNAVDVFESVMPLPSVQERTEAVENGVEACLKVGLTQVHDMGVDLELIQIYKQLIESGRFPFRVYAAIDGFGETWNHYLKEGPEVDANDGKLTVRALKLYADGALGSRGAALIEPYSDDPGNRGLTRASAEEIESAALQCIDKGFQMCTHAIGDRANHVVLNAYEKVFKSTPAKANDARFRIEHAQVIDRTDIERFHGLGVLPMMQPTHCTSDMYWAEDRLGPKRAEGAYAWRSLLDSKSIIPSGSDFPVESPNPLWGFYAAITRQDHSGWPEGGWHPEQSMSREEALKSFTLWGAFAAFEETKRGSIEKGKLADIVVLSDDIMKVEPRMILSTIVEMTIVGGEIVYSSGDSGLLASSSTRSSSK